MKNPNPFLPRMFRSALLLVPPPLPSGNSQEGEIPLKMHRKFPNIIFCLSSKRQMARRRTSSSMHTPVDLKEERIRGSLALFDSRGGALAASSLVFQLHFYMCVRTLLPPPSMHFHLCSASTTYTWSCCCCCWPHSSSSFS